MNSAPQSTTAGSVVKRTWKWWGAVALALLVSCTVQAQNADLGDSTNAVFEAAAILLSNAVAQISELSSTNELGSNDLSQTEQGSGQAGDGSDTNLLAPSGSGVPAGPPESRRQWLLRQRAGRPGTNDGGQSSATARTNGNTSAGYRPTKPEHSAFRMITERNIFDPNRVPHRPGVQSRPSKTIESFALVGVMSYEKGTFAFFDGTSSEYRKALKAADTIAGFKLTSIGNNVVSLVAGTNHVDLRVGMQLRREEGHDWAPGPQAESYAAASSSTSSTPSGTGAGGFDNDILEKLRKKREQE